MAKYELTHAVRSHIGSDDDAFNAIRQREDEVRSAAMLDCTEGCRHRCTAHVWHPLP